MKENDKRKRKDWIKNIAIVFLAVMLILTFFSNTIMNYSLPEVATQYVSAGSISARIRGTGSIQATDPYNVEIKESRVIQSVHFRRGDFVQKGDVLFTLEDKDSTELINAQKELDSLIQSFELELLTGDISADVYNHVQNGKTTSLSQYRSKLDDATNKVDNAQKNVDNWQKKVNDLNNQLNIIDASYVDTSAEELAVRNAETALTNAQAYYEDVISSYEVSKANYEACGMDVATAYQAYLDAYNAWSNNIDPSQADILQTAVTNAKSNYDNITLIYNSYSNSSMNVQTATNNVKNATVAFENAKKALADKQATETTEATVQNLRLQLATAEMNLASANQTLAEAQDAKTELVTKIQQEISLGDKYDQIEEQKKLVEELKQNTTGTTIEAPISGNLINVNFSSGQEAYADSIVAVIQPEDRGYILSFSVTNQQAQKVNVGDMAEIVNGWYYEDVTATLIAIKPDPNDPAKSKLLEFSLTGTGLVADQSLTLSLGQKSEFYELIVPKSAIREDNDGKFILIVESKSSPLGNRYIATRVGVEVLASDDTQSAITGALYGYEYVITTSTKPVVEGKQVRLAD